MAKEPFRCSLAPGQGEIVSVPDLTIYAYHPAEAAEVFAEKYWLLLRHRDVASHAGIDDVESIEVAVRGDGDRRRQYTVTARLRLICSATPSTVIEVSS